jgi:hypothetical protein
MATQVYESAGIDSSVEIPNLESSTSAISWGAIVGGAVAAVAVSFVLAALGSALGLAAVSPWAGAGATATAIGVGTAIWIVVIQWLASAFGGYVTGRLRTKWAAMGTDEVFFRDTAHGFLAWALSTLVVVGFVASAAGGGANLAATVASGAAQGGVQAAAGQAGSMPYFIDTLFRADAQAPANAADGTTSAASNNTPTAAAAAPSDNSAPAAASTAMPSGSATASAVPPATDYRGESARLLARSLTSDMPAADKAYLAQLVAQQTGITQADAEARVDQVTAAVKQDAEAARKAGVAVSFLTALSLLIGALVASAAAAIGGRHRDLL